MIGWNKTVIVFTYYTTLNIKYGFKILFLLKKVIQLDLFFLIKISLKNKKNSLKESDDVL